MSLLYSTTCPNCGKSLVFSRNEEWICYYCGYKIGGEEDE